MKLRKYHLTVEKPSITVETSFSLFYFLLIVTGKVVCENWIKNLLNNFGWSGVNSIVFIDYNNSVYVTDIKELPQLIYLNQDDAQIYVYLSY